MMARATWAAGAAWDRLSWVSASRSASVSGRSGSFLRRDIGGLRVTRGHRSYPETPIMATGEANDPLVSNELPPNHARFKDKDHPLHLLPGAVEKFNHLLDRGGHRHLKRHPAGWPALPDWAFVRHRNRESALQTVV